MASIIPAVTAFITATVALFKCAETTNFRSCFKCKSQRQSYLHEFREYSHDATQSIAYVHNENHRVILKAICEAVDESVQEIYSDRCGNDYLDRINIMTRVFRKYEEKCGTCCDFNVSVIFADCLSAFKHALQHDNMHTRSVMISQTFDTLVQFYTSNLKFIESDTDLLVIMLSSVNEALSQFGLSSVSFQCTDDIHLSVAMDTCIAAAVATDTQLDFIFNDKHYCVVPYEHNAVMLISEENVCKVIGQMVQNRHVPKMIVLTENSIVLNVYVSKHFAVMNWKQEFPVGLSMKMCAHVMQNTMILKKCKQQANFLQTQTSGGTVYFLY